MRRIVLGAGALVALGAGGCMTTGFVRDPSLGAAGYSYAGGKASQGFSYPSDRVQEAVVLAMGDLEVRPSNQVQDGRGLTYEGKTIDGRHVAISIQSQAALPVVTAKVGWFGDEAMSRALMDRIGIRLGSLPPSAIPAEPPSHTASPSTSSRFSRSAVSDSTMLRGQSDAGYHDSPVAGP